MKRRLVVEIDDEVVTVEGGGDDLDDKSKANLLMLAAKKLRVNSEVLQLVIFKDVKSQAVGMDFQKDEIKDWGEAIGMLEQAVRVASFQQWYNMFMAANQGMAQAAQAEMQKIQLAGNGAGRLFKGPHR